MLNVVHVTATAAMARVWPDPGFVWPLSVASHIALDTIPHWNWHPAGNKMLIAASIGDVAASVGLSYIFASHSEHFWVTLIACLLSIVPDVIQGPYHLLGWRPVLLARFINWERNRQKWDWVKPWMGIATQIAVVIICLLIWSWAGREVF